MDLLEEIAFYLPDWRLDKRTEPKMLLGPLKAQIYIREEGGRLRFSGVKPSRQGRGYYSWECYGMEKGQHRKTRISCAKARGGRAIAKDLENRLIRYYLPLYKDALKRVAEERRTLDELGHVEALVIRALKGRKQGFRGNDEPRRTVHFNGGSAVISTYRGGCIDLNIGDLSYSEGIKLSTFLYENIYNRRNKN